MKEEFLAVFRILGISSFEGPPDYRSFTTAELVQAMRENGDYLEEQQSFLEHRLRNEGNLGNDMLWFLHRTTDYVSRVINGSVPVLLERNEVNEVATTQVNDEPSDRALARHLRRVIGDQVKTQSAPISEAVVQRITDAMHDYIAAGVPANGKFLNTNQIASRLGLSAKTVRRLCDEKQILATKLAGGTWRTTQEELERSPYLTSNKRRNNAAMK